jgi:Domain of unknown function (DUF5615)
MRFLLDENFPKAAVSLLDAAGHEAFDFRGTGEEGMADSEVFQKAQDLSAILLTWIGISFIPSHTSLKATSVFNRPAPTQPPSHSLAFGVDLVSCQRTSIQQPRLPIARQHVARLSPDHQLKCF